VEARVQTPLEAVYNKAPERIRQCYLQKLIISVKFRKSVGINGIQNECLMHLPRRLLVYLSHLFNHSLRLNHFPKSWKEAKIITLPKPGRDPKFPQNLRPIGVLSTKGNLFEKVILKISESILSKEALLKASQFGFRASEHRTLQCMRLIDYVTLIFNNTIPTAAVFLDIEKAFDTIWHSGLPYNSSKLEFFNSWNKLIKSFLSQRKFIFSEEGEIVSTPREMRAGVLQVAVLSPTMYNMYINDALKQLGFSQPSLPKTLVCARPFERRAFLSENSSAVSAQWRPGASTGI
jgi:hypothetical protein